MHDNMYLICNIGLTGGKITYCQSACMVVYQPTQEKEKRREKLVWLTKTTLIQSPHIHARKFFPARLPIHQPYRRFLSLSSPFATPLYLGVFLLMDTYLWGIDKVPFLWLKNYD